MHANCAELLTLCEWDEYLMDIYPLLLPGMFITSSRMRGLLSCENNGT